MADISSEIFSAGPSWFNLPTSVKPSTMTPPRNEPKQTDASLEPYLPLSESRLRCAAKRRLHRAFRQAHSNKTVVDWLFGQYTQPFHNLPVLTPSSFENALGLHGNQVLEGLLYDGSTVPMKIPGSKSGASSSPVEPGKDVLFIPVIQSQGKLMGYTFGGLPSEKAHTNECPLGIHSSIIFPHYVGRFVFDSALGDLLIAANGLLNGRGCGIANIRVGDKRGTRERSLFVVPQGQFAIGKLPARIHAMVTTEETRLSSLPKYQFAINVPSTNKAGPSNRTGSSGSGSSHRSGSSSGDSKRSSDDQLKTLLAHMERLLKGKFTSDRICRDDLNLQTGEVSNRRTATVRSEFDVMDAVRMRVFKDGCLRNYYSFMASIAAKKKRR